MINIQELLESVFILKYQLNDKTEEKKKNNVDTLFLSHQSEQNNLPITFQYTLA